MSIATRVLRLSVLAVAASTIASAAKADTSLYTDGPINGTYDALNITGGYQVQDSFTLSSSSTLDGVSFGNWLLPGDTASTVDWAIVDSEGSQVAVCGSCSGTASLTAGVFSPNSFGYDVGSESLSLGGVNLAAGTYWLALQNEAVTGGDSGYWDENGGPSMVWQSGSGDLSGDNCTTVIGDPSGACSNSFTIVGHASTGVTPEPGSLALLFSGITLIGAEIRRRRIL